MKINRDSGRAYYRQVADRLRDRIETGQLQPGEDLPSEAELEDEYGVGAGTVRRAIPILVREGLIESERGQNHRVAHPIDPEVITVGPDAEIWGTVARPADAAAHGVPEGAYVLVIAENGRERMYVASHVRIRSRR